MIKMFMSLYQELFLSWQQSSNKYFLSLVIQVLICKCLEYLKPLLLNKSCYIAQ